MESLIKHQENQSFLPSPKSYSSNSSSSSANSANNVLKPPQSPIPITRSEPNNPYPTTFVQADTSSFKHVVQMLTGSSEPKPPPSEPKHDPHRNVKTIPKIMKSSSKLYERRNSLKNFKISPIGHPKPGHVTGSMSPRPGTPEILSPSILDFPSLALSPVTPLIPDPFNRVGSCKSNLVNVEAEEKAIAEKGFFMHPSPVSTPTDTKPKLLPLFPETSPRVAGSSDTGS